VKTNSNHLNNTNDTGNDENTTPMEESVKDRQLHMRILKFTQIGSCVNDDMASLQKNPTLAINKSGFIPYFKI
jgi:hypothetical protein